MRVYLKKQEIDALLSWIPANIAGEDCQNTINGLKSVLKKLSGKKENKFKSHPDQTSIIDYINKKEAEASL